MSPKTLSDADAPNILQELQIHPHSTSGMSADTNDAERGGQNEMSADPDVEQIIHDFKKRIDEDFSLEEQQLLQNLFAPVLRQAMAVQGYVQERCDEEIGFPEVLVMVSIILSECFPSSTHEHQ